MKLGVPRAIMEALSKLIYDYTNAKTPSIPAHQGIATAVRAQIRIGLHLLPQGFIATEWIQVIEDFSIGRPERKVASILKTLWLDFTDQLWRNRNAIAHAKENLNSLAEAQHWADKLKWYLKHPESIARTDDFLLRFKANDIQNMTATYRQKLALRLETAQKVFDMEKMQREKGQAVIRDFFPSSNN